MSKIVVLSGEGPALQRVAITTSDALSTQEAIGMCEAAVKYFQERLIESEVARRLAEKEAKEVEAATS